MLGAPKTKPCAASTARNNAVAGEGSCGGGGAKDVGETGALKGAEDIGEDVMMSKTQFLRKIRKSQRMQLDLAKQENSLPFASVLGQHGPFPISFKLIPSLLTNDNYPSNQMFSFVLERCLKTEDYHANSTILSFSQIHAKHAIISVSIFIAQWYICSGPDTHPLTLNNESVGQDQVQLHDGDIIVIGNVELKFACGVQ